MSVTGANSQATTVDVLSASVASQLLYRVQASVMTISLGLALRLAIAHLTGNALRANELAPRSSNLPWASIGAAASVEFPLAGDFGFLIGLEGGAVMLRAVASHGSEDVAQLQHVWMCAWAGFAWAL